MADPRLLSEERLNEIRDWTARVFFNVAVPLPLEYQPPTAWEMLPHIDAQAARIRELEADATDSKAVIEAMARRNQEHAARVEQLEAALRECVDYLETLPWSPSLAVANRERSQNEGEDCLEHAKKVLEEGQ